jgi:16S rRNA (cytosine967-C5)-methyltransferase
VIQWHYYVVNQQKPREIAINLLRERAAGGEFIENQLERKLAAASLKPEDKRLLQEIVYGSIRWQSTLDWLIAQKSKPQKQNPIVQILLRTALYQMFWLSKIPSYAAVNETIEMARKFGLEKQAGFINAVLRSFDREREQTRAALDHLKISSPAAGFSHPEWLARKWERRWPREKVAALLELNNKTPPTCARVNLLRGSTEELLKMWKAEGVEAEPISLPGFPDAQIFKLNAHPQLANLASFNQGRFYIQDPSTLAAVELLNPQPGESVLDVCAAPGGKTVFMAEKMKNSGRIAARDLDPKRLDMVKANAARMGAANVVFESKSDEKFDRVLLDAPCSNTGVLRRRVELRWRVIPEEIQRLAETQFQLLQRAAEQLKPGGVLVYSTCSIEPEENQAVAQRFLQSHPGWILEQEIELTPLDGVDGAYAAKFRQQS